MTSAKVATGAAAEAQAAIPHAPAGLPADTATKTLEIRVSLPQIPTYADVKKRLPLKLRSAPRKAKIIGGAACVVTIASIGGYQLFTGQLPGVLPGSQPTTASSRLTRGTPDYQTILPAGKTIESLGGWTRVSPPDRNPVFAYVDQVGPAQLSVSQQPLPEGFKPDTSKKVEELAVSFQANEKIAAAGTTIHIGSSAQGPQSVIFGKEDLLVLIKSSVRVDNDQWIKYVNSLR